jgi:hypothetical protein
VNRSTPIPTQIEHARANLNVIPAIPSPAAEAVGTVTRGPRDGDGRWLYESYVPIGDDEVIVRMIDPLGRVTEQRAPVADVPPPLPDLTGLRVRMFFLRLNVRVLSSAPIFPPLVGEFLLELFDITSGAEDLLALAALHDITTTPKTGRWWRSGPDANGRYTYSITLAIGLGSIDRVRVRLTDPSGRFSELEDSV